MKTLPKKAPRTELCPNCGRWTRYLHEVTGFCQSCTYELKR